MDTLKQMSFDAIVVGSGPGGAAVTRELSRYGRRVLILERGSEEPIEGTVRQCASMAMVPGKSLLVTRQCLALIRGITYGGSSVLAYACAFDPPYEMFDSHGVDLRAEVERLKQELPIAPLADELFGPAARRIMESARALGYAWNRLPKIVYQENCRPECDKCTVGCPHAAKWTARLFIDEALESGSVLVTGAHVKSVLIRNGTATGVSFTKSGREHRVSAPVIVLAAGGIGTPLILRQSGVAGAGYDFFFDPLIIAMGKVDERHKGKEFPMAAGYRDEADGYLMTDLVWPRWTFRLFAIEVLRFHRLGSHGRMLPIMVKLKDGLGGRLTRRGGVHKWVDAQDRARLLRGVGRATEILHHAGARRVFKTWFIATHPGGTAKIGDVVDQNLRTEFDRLYVCDCSVIPEPWGLPPMLTLLALGTRLGRHLATDGVFN